jgi:hypothetical protein
MGRAGGIVNSPTFAVVVWEDGGLRRVGRARPPVVGTKDRSIRGENPIA